MTSFMPTLKSQLKVQSKKVTLRLNYLATIITADEANSSLDPYNEMLEKFSEFSGKATSLGSCERKV